MSGTSERGLYGRFTFVLVIAVIAIAAAIGGCGDDDDSSSSDDGEANGGSADLAAVIDELDAGTNVEPSGEPVEAQPGKNVWIISCGQQVETCSGPVAGAEEAAQELGWETTIFDGKADPAEFANGIRQAIAGDADGMIVMSVDCALVTAPLQQAEQAGVEVVSMVSVDCDSPLGGGGQARYKDREVVFAGFPGFEEYYAAWSAAKAAWIADKVGPDGKVINFVNEEFPVYQLITQGFQDGMQQYCPDCEVVDVDFRYADLGSRAQQIAEQALLQNPDAGAVHIPDDGTAAAGLTAGIRSSGRAAELEVIAGEGLPTNIDAIRQGNSGQNASLAQPVTWIGWAGADSLNSVFAGEKPRDSGIGWQLVDADHNLPESGPYEPDVDYRSAYAELWK